jgi:hypothetical protein
MAATACGNCSTAEEQSFGTAEKQSFGTGEKLHRAVRWWARLAAAILHERLY